MKYIEVKNAHIHNLKNINIKIPKNMLVVITGVSGSGKTSLILDTVYEEGKRNYLNNIGIPQDIPFDQYYDYIKGLGPTVAITGEFKKGNHRSVVGTRTGIYENLKILYLSDGIIKCDSCQSNIKINKICPECGHKNTSIKYRELSFNTHAGMCKKCEGNGYKMDIDIDKIIMDKRWTLPEICAANKKIVRLKNQLSFFAEALSFNLHTPYDELPETVRNAFLNGLQHKKSNFRGILPYLKSQIIKNGEMSEVISKSICPDCNGTRLGESSRLIKINDKNITQVTDMSMTDLSEFISQCLQEENLSSIGIKSLNAIRNRVEDLINVDLSYLTLFRPIPTLSGGELQRLKLAMLLDASMESLTFVIDEPTVGLHVSEKDKIIDKIIAIREKGNSVLVIEHDHKVIEKAEHIIDIGKWGGEKGGNILYQGNLNGLLQCKDSIIGQNLIEKNNQLFKDYRLIDNSLPLLKMKNITINNIKNLEVNIPLNRLVGIAGISGSGKSSLISGALHSLLKSNISDGKSVEFNDEDGSEEDFQGNLQGCEHIDNYVRIVQTPIGKNNKSIPLTYLDILNPIQKLYASLKLSVERQYTVPDFSFNSKGACSLCGGTGIGQDIFGEVDNFSYMCPKCHGKRYRKDILDIEYKGKTIEQVLNMEVSEGVDFFAGEKKIYDMLKSLQNLSLGYLRLGQPTLTLSAGESQRLKLAKALGKKRKGNTLYLFDEPSIGMSLYDTKSLLSLFHQLVDLGNSIIVIEHDLQVLSQCDWIIELGPGSADKGGKVIATGTAKEIVKIKESIIGPYLKNEL